jgi:hypothetical protein
MVLARAESVAIALAMVLGYLAGVPAALAGEPDISLGFEKCRIIADDRARLDCLKKLLAPAPAVSPEAKSGQDTWPLIVTHRSAGGRDAVAIMRTADTSRSDPDLAGLMIRCGEKPGFEVLLAVVRPFPPRARRDVVIGSGATQMVLQAKISSLGTGIILPVEATVFTTGPWQGLKELSVAIKAPEMEIRGVIPLDGLAPAMTRLSANCPSG